ncbi:hypothetical protein C5167_004327 [Papaver somniferum]|uniref:Uncharacterized protein n=1 Tax=Papaver somniferum TaxID=3469 RepID=A0A4Y7J7A3_PAPSO|nr:uncharacterized protein At3g49055-like [Papaver somniferum]RZC57023.1 hypothetical protein C5167_004327 [Papaver somniferum]
MEITREDSFNNHNHNLSDDELHLQNEALGIELEVIRASYDDIRSKFLDLWDNLATLHQENEELVKQNGNLAKNLEEISSERDDALKEVVRIEMSAREQEEELAEQREKFDVFEEIIGELVEEKRQRMDVFSRGWDSIRSVKEFLDGIIERMDEEKPEKITLDEEVIDDLKLDDATKGYLSETMYVDKLVKVAESRFTEYESKKLKEKKELENSLASLTQENRDVHSLLRIALVEKESVEKTLSKLRGNEEQKRGTLLGFAQRVRFGFMRSNSTNEDSVANSSSKMSEKSDSECEEETVSLASTVEKMMKGLRLEISQLKKSLEESRSETERLQSLTEKQAHQIAELTLYIKDLEGRETNLSQNVEQLAVEINAAEEEISRWKEACELEVEAGKNAVEERDKEAKILREELNRTKASLDTANNKIKLKEELASAAFIAQKAIEKSLLLADSRAGRLREIIEDLTKQLEEADSKGERTNKRRKVRHVCWPWRALQLNPTRTAINRRVRSRMVPEMESLLLFNV